MNTLVYPTSSELTAALKRPELNSVNLESLVKEVFEQVKSNGDKAIVDFVKQFDQIELNNLKVSQEEIEEATKGISIELKQAIETAAANIRIFHAAQQEKVQIIETMPGVNCWRKSVGIEKVGLYIPGGTAPLFSTVLMLGIPANIAACKQVVLCTPCGKDEKVHPAILFAAQLTGITEIYKIGGIQAIAAMTLGTETIPKVYKIFGPGNQYVTAAKQYAQKLGMAIDMPAGPSEVMLVADNSAIPQFIAADLLSQAEHGADSQVVLVTTDQELVIKVGEELKMQLEQLPRKELAEKALKNSVALVVQQAEICSIINTYAPEHLILQTLFNDELIDGIINAGSVFIGNYTPESAGDYASGTNHTLPTNGYAKQYSGVSLDSFVKKITFQEITEVGIQNIGSTIELMAEAEGLEAHKNAVTVRLTSLK
ncbi:MAG: histidinol dehydrogenase [Crocinitomicaceae bacterium]|jgi:histidinol dehydrogenase|nr:histidinol dehydrogenase [Crocinitomicaceae bacterium]